MCVRERLGYFPNYSIFCIEIRRGQSPIVTLSFFKTAKFGKEIRKEIISDFFRVTV